MTKPTVWMAVWMVVLPTLVTAQENCTTAGSCIACVNTGCTWIPEDMGQCVSSCNVATIGSSNSSSEGGNIFSHNNATTSDLCITDEALCEAAVVDGAEDGGDDPVDGMGLGGNDNTCALLGTNSSCTECLSAGEGTCAWRPDDATCTNQCLLTDTPADCVSSAVVAGSSFMTPQQICDSEPPPPLCAALANATNNAAIPCDSCLEIGCSHSQTYVDGTSLCLQECNAAENHTTCFAADANATSADVCDTMLEALPFAPNPNLTSVAPRPTPLEGSNGTLVTTNDTLATNDTLPIDSNANASVTPRPTPAPLTACSSQDDCGEGTFCSSSTSFCTELNCTNWIAGTPSGENFYSEAPCEEERSFCGLDGSCKDYSCDNWYQYGPVAFTGYDPTNPVELECEDYDTGEEDLANSMVFGCRPYMPDQRAPKGNSWAFFFNQKCTSKPRGGTEFECYQNKPNTDYNDFLAEIARINLDSCDRETYEGIIEQPIFWYNLVLRQVRKGNTTNYKNGREDTVNTPSFDPSEADQTMFAVVITDDPVPEQFFGEATDPENPNSGAAAMAIRTWWLAATAGLLVVCGLV